MKITQFDINICRENVFALIECYEDSAVYEEVVEEYEEMLPHAYKKIHPVALLEFGDTEEFDLTEYGDNIDQALYCITSVGGELSEWSSKLFEQGDYLGGMLADAIADDYLFQMDHQLMDAIISLCQQQNCGVSRRLEAPQDIPMSVQKKALDVTGGAEESTIRVLDSFMYDPVKTTCQVYLTEKNSSLFQIHHNCSKCPNVGCKLRNISSYAVTVRQKESFTVLSGKKGQSLLELLQAERIFLPAVCAGRGTCGKCKVQVLEGELNPSAQDISFFKENELEQGMRLACCAYPERDCVISLNSHGEDSFEVLAETGSDNKKNDSLHGGTRYGIAADIGTTTIAMQRVNLDTKETEQVFTTINRQRAFGADVISRIEASNNGKKDALQKSIQKDLLDGIDALTGKGTIVPEKMVIGANTTMVHLLMGYSCETLGFAPFTPVNLGTIHTTGRELLGATCPDFSVTVLPGISTYVGGDIVAGLYALDFDRLEKTTVLIDLGTNGEMAIGRKSRILATSTAAGPAFEGGNITYGTGSVPGAVCKVKLQEGQVCLETIQHAQPIGICGTGVIDAAYELLQAELIDETGLLDEEYFENGFLLTDKNTTPQISIFQKDIREIQLAKSAVRAGLETLLMHYNVTYEEIDCIYIAGGFGYKMDIHKAVGIGLLPEQCQGKIKAVGNSCLSGTKAYLLEEKTRQRTEHIRQISTEIQLANDKHFNQFYMDYMCFEK